MAVKIFSVPDIGELTVYKRRGARSMRLSISSEGSLRVTIPSYVPFQAAIAFAQSKRVWIQEHAETRQTYLENAQQIGKTFRVRFLAVFKQQQPTSRLIGKEIIVQYPAGLDTRAAEVQKVAKNACIRALRREAELYLPARLRGVSEQHGFTYNSCSIKQLKGRWGSCDQDQNIVLNLYLMQLPWRLIDYVLLHELVHTRHLDHGNEFWQTFITHEKEAKLLKKEIRSYQPNFVLPQAV